MRRDAFLRLLRCALDDGCYSDIWAWSSDGLSFVIKNQEAFVNTALPALGEGIVKFSSFVKRCTRHGIKKHRAQDKFYLTRDTINQRVPNRHRRHRPILMTNQNIARRAAVLNIADRNQPFHRSNRITSARPAYFVPPGEHANDVIVPPLPPLLTPTNHQISARAPGYPTSEHVLQATSSISHIDRGAIGMDATVVGAANSDMGLSLLRDAAVHEAILPQYNSTSLSGLGTAAASRDMRLSGKPFYNQSRTSWSANYDMPGMHTTQQLMENVNNIQRSIKQLERERNRELERLEIYHLDDIAQEEFYNLANHFNGRP